MSGIADWLASHGLEKYTGVFAEAEIDFDVLRELTEADLEKLGLPLGPRKRLLKAIGALHVDDNRSAESPAEPAPAAARRAGPEAERRQLTVLFADMVGSTALSQGMDPEELREVIRGFQDAAAGAVARFDGYVAKFMGDGLLAYFGWPRAHEDDAERAVRAGLALVDAARLLKRPQEVRVGISTGLVVVGDVVGSGGAREEAGIGETLNLAARLQGEATPGAVVVASETRGLLGSLFELESLGPRHLKGIAEPVEPWRVVGESQTDSRFESVRTRKLNRLVGRDQELGLTLARWEQAKAGEGQAVLLRADPGVGKSRIVAELRQRVDAEPVASLRYQCSPHHVSSALYPVIQQLMRAARIEASDTADAKRLKLMDLARQSNIESSEAVGLLAALLSIPADETHPPPTMTPQEQKAATLGLLCDLLAGLTASGPVLVVVEDLHWSDPTTRELLDLIISRLENLPVLMLVTFRPEIDTPWEGRGHVTLVTLNRLGRRQVDALIGEVAGKETPEAVIDQIVAKADGVPLFVEELTKTILASGLLKPEGDKFVLAGALPPLAVPSSLQASLVSRLDRLAPVREVAQIGAALGREFEFDLLAAVVPHGHDQLVEALQELHRSEIVFPRGTPPRCPWSYKHALIQEAAYETMLKSARARLHGRIAQVMKRSFPSLIETEPEVYARHLTEAASWRDAIESWRSAAHHAARRSAASEAAALFRRAINLIPHLESREERESIELDLQVGLASTLMAVSGFGADEVGTVLNRARELSSQVAQPAERFRILNGLWRFHFVRGELDRSMQIALEAKQISEAVADDGLVVEAENALGVTYFSLGTVQKSIEHLKAGLQAYNSERHSRHIVQYARDPGVNCSSYLCMAFALAGFPDRAKRQIAFTVELNSRLKHGLTACVAFFGVGFASCLFRDLPSTERFGELLHEVGVKNRIAMGVGLGLVYVNWARAWSNPPTCSLEEMGHGISVFGAATGNRGAPYLGLLRAEAMLRLGRLEDVVPVLSEVSLQAKRNGLRAFEAEGFRLRGLVSRLNQQTEAAETCLRQALEIIEETEARLFQLRAATDLARLLLDQGKQTAARETLDPIYAWFTEGFDTPDLLAARAVLERCG